MTTTTTSHPAAATTAVRPSTHMRDRALAVGTAAGAALALWVVADPLLGIDLRVSMGSEADATMAIGPALVIVNAVVASLAGWGLLAALERFGRRPRAVWTAFALAATLLSLFGPLTGAVTLATMIALVAMHLVVAAALIPMLRGTARPDREARP